MLLAQDITVEVSPDPLSLVVSVVAVIIATLVAVITYVQGRAIRNIETREHEWQRIDRLSADIEVVRMREVEPRSSASITKYSRRDWIRLRNTGRAEAEDVTWMMDRGSFKGKDVMLGDREGRQGRSAPHRCTKGHSPYGTYVSFLLVLKGQVGSSR